MIDLSKRRCDLNPIHPGQIVRTEILSPARLTVEKAAKLLDFPLRKFQKFLKGQDDLDYRLAGRLADIFGSSAEDWLYLQALYDNRRIEDFRGRLPSPKIVTRDFNA